MALSTLSPDERDAAIRRFRDGVSTEADRAWLRVVEVPGDGLSRPRLACDCRCHCHAGVCRNPIYLDELDCRMACRSSHILAGHCAIDEGRPAWTAPEPMHPGAELTGGSIPPHVPGAYPSLSCCGGPVRLVEAIR